MVATLGYFSVLFTLLIALYGIAAFFIGLRLRNDRWLESGRIAGIVVFVGLSLALAYLVYLFAGEHYEVAYVYSVSSHDLPFYVRIASLWAGQAGSLLLWVWLLSVSILFFGVRHWQGRRDLLGWIMIVALVTLIFFLLQILLVENPFARFWLMPDGSSRIGVFKPEAAELFKPIDGLGLDPRLHHPAMLLRLPLLYVGFTGLVAPFAFAIGGLAAKRRDDLWLILSRRWTLAAWFCLTIGIALGMRWYYDVLGWGGYWGWATIEIATLMPWLTATAFIHSNVIVKRRGIFKRWSIFLAIITFELVIFGTFLTRSDAISSLHQLSKNFAGAAYLIFMFLSFLGSLVLLVSHWKRLKMEGRVGRMISREVLFLMNGIVFVCITLICFWGVVSPLVTELFNGPPVFLGTGYFERALGPFFIVLFIIMGVAPLVGWQRTSMRILGKLILWPFLVSLLIILAAFLSGVRSYGALFGIWLSALVGLITLYEIMRGAWLRCKNKGKSLATAFWQLVTRNHRRYGGYIIHIGIILMAIAFIGVELMQSKTQATLRIGESVSCGDFILTYEGMTSVDTEDDRNMSTATLSVMKGSRAVGAIYPQRQLDYRSMQTFELPGIRRSLEEDIYAVVVEGMPFTAEEATFKIYQNPLVNWLWIGIFVFVVGMLLAIWPYKMINVENAVS